MMKLFKLEFNHKIKNKKLKTQLIYKIKKDYNIIECLLYKSYNQNRKILILQMQIVIIKMKFQKDKLVI